MFLVTKIKMALALLGAVAVTWADEFSATLGVKEGTSLVAMFTVAHSTVNKVKPTVAGLRDDYESRSFSLITSSVPEPESYAMLLAGLGLVGTIARRRTRASVT